MKLTDRTTRVLRYSAFGAIISAAAVSPLGFAGADPQDRPAPPPATVTATVTAMVAPGQCDPIPDGKLPQQAVDYATVDGKIVTPAPEAPADDKMDGEDTESPKGDAAAPAEGPVHGVSVFDPYLCDPASAERAEDVDHKKDNDNPKAQVPDEPKLPRGVTPTLKQYPGGGQNGLAEGGEGGSKTHLGDPDPKATPTENPTPRAPVLNPSNPMG